MPRLAYLSIVVLALACLPPAIAGGVTGGDAGDEPLSAKRVSLESVRISGPEDVQRLERLGFDVTHDVSGTDATVALYSDAERSRLDAAGFSSRTVVADLQEKSAADRAAEDDIAIPTALPSGRSTYRVYEDYVNEINQLAEDNPDFVRKVTIGQTLEGRPITGLEIASEVNRQDDGRPAYLQLGLHHAREWPSGEFPMEFAIDLVNGYNGNVPRITNLLDEVRIFIFPVINADGFIASRGAAPSAGGAPVIVGGFNEFRRKNCRPAPGDASDAAVPCALRPTSGVDLNRNYGYYWGGPGSSSSASSESYRGTGPYSEPESQAVHQLSSGLHPTVVISNHTFTDSGWWLRQPGFNASFFPQEVAPYSPGCDASLATFDCSLTPDEPAMKALGDDMGAATGWPSDLGWELGDITGATEDWNYFAQGAYGYTPEARGLDFHSLYSDMVIEEYEGDATHVGLGMREAMLRAGEVAADPSEHSRITGTVPPGATLTLHKEFDSPSHPNAPGNPITHEVLDSTLRGPADGTYEWHVEPSDRPQFPGSPLPAGDEQWTMTCQQPGQNEFTTTVEVARGGQTTVNWAGGPCGTDPVTNLPPVADFSFSPAAPEAGQRVNFISTSTDPDGAIDPSKTEWDLDGNGTFETTGLTATQPSYAVGAHTVRLKVTDDDNASDVEVKVINVSTPTNLPPLAGFTFFPSAPSPGQNVVFTSTSTDTDGNVAELAWDFDADGFDDGLGGQVTRAFTTAGSYPVALRATDNDGAFSIETHVVTIGPQPTSPTPPSDEPTCRGRAPTIMGTSGDDRLRGTDGNDSIAALGGDDRVFGLGGNDTVCGGGGNDRLNGGAGGDALLGNKGDDRLRGGGGGDLLLGGPGRDKEAGGAGKDRCGGRLGNCP